MWRKSEDSKPKSSPGVSPSTINEMQFVSVSSAQHPGTAAPQGPVGTPAAVSRGIKIKGEISGHGNLFLEGEFEGKIVLDSGTFTVGPNARVRAEIEAPEVIIRGEVIGTLKSCERVHIWSTGKLTGDMETRGIVIEDGAVLNSKVVVPQAPVPEVSASEIDRPAQLSSPEPPPRAKGAGAS
jgi:cytoskeletal protein CcmA (bactofilin family)